jgi:hypothetical protein
MDLLASRVIFLRTPQRENHHPAKGTAHKAEGPVFAYYPVSISTARYEIISP